MKKIKVIDIVKKSAGIETQNSLRIENENSNPKNYAPEEKNIKIEPLDPQKGKVLEEITRNIKIEHKPRVHHSAHKSEFNKKRIGPRILLVAGGFVLLGILGYSVINILPRAEIKINSKKTDWEYKNPITINPKIADIDVSSRQIPAAVFYEKRNATIAFPATGKKFGDKFASGKIIVYNNYSANSQPLIAGTRFQAPDGKIFKLQNRIIIPGAKNSGGKIVPSEIEADVIAEQPGDAYNIPPVKKFAIPGFAGSDKFNGFYGQSKTAMSGGVQGESAYPADDDISKGKQSAEAQIKDIVNSFIYSQIPEGDLKVIDSGKQFKILKEIVNKNTDENGNFAIFIEAEATAQAFKESHLVKLMSVLGQQAIGDDYALKGNEYKIDYGAIAADSKGKIMSLPVDFKATFWKPFNTDDFKSRIAGKSESDLKAVILSSSNIEKADVSFWPFWVSKVPSDSKKIKIVLQ